MAIIKTTANLINTNGILSKTQIPLTWNWTACVKSWILEQYEKLYLDCKSATSTNICCSHNELNLFQWYGPFTINSLKIQNVTYNKLKNFWILQKTGQIYDPEVCRCVFPASRTFLNSFYTLGKYQCIYKYNII